MPTRPALGANAGHNESMTRDAKILFEGHRIPNLLNLLAVKLDQPVADLTVEMIMLGIAVVMLKYRPAGETHFTEKRSNG